MSRRDGSIYVGRLTKNTRTKDLEDIFEPYGKLLRCDIKYGSEMAYAFIDFEDRRDAEDCVKYEHGRELNGQNIIVEWAKGGKDRRMARRPDSSSQTYDECFRCRRTGHWARDCPEYNNWGRRGGGVRGGGSGRRWSPSPRRRRSRSTDRRRRSRSRSDNRRSNKRSHSRDRKRSRSRSGGRKSSRSNSGSRSGSEETKKDRRSKSGSQDKKGSTSRSRSKSPPRNSNSKSPRQAIDNHAEEQAISDGSNENRNNEGNNYPDENDDRRSRSGSHD